MANPGGTGPLLDSFGSGFSRPTSLAKRAAKMRSAVVILTLFGLILLVFSPVWYGNFTGQTQVIVTTMEVKAEKLPDAGS